MDAKKERKTTTEKILGKSCNNFLHEYLLQRKNDASFVENSQTEHSWYLAELKEQRRLNVQSAEIAFNAASAGCSCNDPLVRVDFQQARVSAGYSCDDPLVRLKSISLHLARASAGCSCDDPLTEKKTQVVRNFWKEIEEKTAIQTASLGHLNIFGRALTQYAYKQEVLTEGVKLRPPQKRENETEENVSSCKKVKESMNIPDIHEQKGQCTEPIAENNPFFDNNIDDESYGESLNLYDDNSNCEISEVYLDTEKIKIGCPRANIAETSPLSSQPELDFVSRDNHELDSLLDNGHVDCPAIINDVMKLQLGSLPREESRWILNNLDVSEKWHLFKEKSLELANKEGLFVESHTQQILSLSHVLLLKPKQHCPLMLEVFGGDLLETMHKDIIKRFTKQESEFDEKTLIELIRIIKLLQRNEIDRDKAVSELQILAVDRSYGERAILKAIRNIIERVPRTTLKSPIGEVELCTTYIDPILCPLFSNPDCGIFLRWSNKQAEESKARKQIGRAKQPDAIINEIDQLSWGLSKGHGEAKVQEEANNLYLLCTDLIRIAVFNKDAIDFYNMNCMLGFQVVGQHITFYLTTLLCDALYVMVEVSHVDAPMSLEEVPAFLTSLDTLLIISNTFWDNCIVSTENKESSRRSTLETPSFKEMVSK
ncbi:15230_t:CDS:10, partial [Funneliformis geosporum]